jgi:hypothetical protein
LARTIGVGNHVGEARKERGNRATNRFLRDAAVKTQAGSDLCDQVRGQELHHYGYETCGHGDLSILIMR